MGFKRPLVHNGKSVMAEDLSFKPLDMAERTIYAALPDGGTIKLLFGVVAISRLEGEMDATGNPVHFVEPSFSYTYFPPEKKKEIAKQ